MNLRPVSMDFKYGTSFGERSPSAYETLLLDAILGDATLYTRQDMVEASWQVVEPISELVGRASSIFRITTPGPGARGIGQDGGAGGKKVAEWVDRRQKTEGRR